MEIIITENRRTRRAQVKSKVQQENDLEREMMACLGRLKEWQTENLMAPHGMDRFREEDVSNL